MGIIGLSDPSGHYEAVVFSEGLQQLRDVLEPGVPVLLTLSAELQGDDVRARIQMAVPLDQAAAKLGKGLRIFLRSEAPVESVAKRLQAPTQLTRTQPSATHARSRQNSGQPGQPGPSTSDQVARERGDGEVALILMLPEGTEVEVKLPGHFKTSPQVAGALKAVPGVVAVEAV